MLSDVTAMLFDLGLYHFVLQAFVYIKLNINCNNYINQLAKSQVTHGNIVNRFIKNKINFFMLLHEIS